ncbi:MAG: peptide ABC transporter substrate-binding protein [Chloroflexi bacterium]|nr:peptide ABC transporter substrate-binding protein [Chloroflexota bacterium]
MPLLVIANPLEDPLIITSLYLERLYEPKSAHEGASELADSFAEKSGFKVISEGEVSLGTDTSGYGIVFDYNYDNSVPLRSNVTSIVRGSQAYTFFIQAMTSSYSMRQSIIEQLLQSFTLIEPTPFGVSRQNSLFLLEGDIVTLDPALTEGGDGDIIRAIFSGLVQLDKNLEVAPDIAESWEVSDDGMTYTFHLRRNARFHDGKPVIAQDFKYSWERVCNLETESKKASVFLGDIIGASQMLNGEATELSGVRVIDDLTLEVTIDGPKPYFLDKLAYITAFVVDRANVARGMNWTDEPNGTGPFGLKEWKKDELLILERNDDYYLEPAKLEHVVLQIFAGRPMMMYEQGEIDVTGVSIYDMDRVLDPADPLNEELLSEPDLGMGYLGFNVTMPPFDDPKIRRTFALALDMDKVLEVSLKGIAERAGGFVPAGIPGHNEELEPFTFDAELAKQLIAESKYGSVDNLPPVVFYTLYALGPMDEAMIGMWQANLGVPIEVEIIEEREDWLERQHRHEFQIFSSGWIADYVDPQNFLEILFHSLSEDNNFAYSNAEVDTALERAAVERDEETRLAMYQDIEKMILEDLPAVPFYQSVMDYTLVKPYVEGDYMTPLQIHIWKDLSINPH